MSRRATARLFVAVDPPRPVREALAAWAREVTAALARQGGGRAAPALRLLDPDLLHITVCFLGERPVDEIAALSGALQGCAGHACELSPGAPLWLPERRPRALVVEVRDEAGELARLHDDLARSLPAVSGWEPQRRRFRAHVTVARMRPAARDRGRPHAPLPATPGEKFTPPRLSLYRSWLAPAGASYEEIAGCALTPAAA